MTRDSVIYIVDDDDAARESMGFLLRSVGLETEVFDHPQDFLDAVEPDQVGCAVLDLRLPEASGIEIMNRLRKKGIAIPVIIVTAYGDVATAVRAIKNGAVDVLEKPVNDQVLIEQIQKCIELDRASDKARTNRRAVEARIQKLTPREEEVLRLIARGLSTKEAARSLGISPKTVENHRTSIRAKTGSKSVADLVHLVNQLDLP